MKQRDNPRLSASEIASKVPNQSDPTSLSTHMAAVGRSSSPVFWPAWASPGDMVPAGTGTFLGLPAGKLLVCWLGGKPGPWEGVSGQWVLEPPGWHLQPGQPSRAVARECRAQTLGKLLSKCDGAAAIPACGLVPGGFRLTPPFPLCRAGCSPVGACSEVGTGGESQAWILPSLGKTEGRRGKGKNTTSIPKASLTPPHPDWVVAIPCAHHPMPAPRRTHPSSHLLLLYIFN